MANIFQISVSKLNPLADQTELYAQFKDVDIISLMKALISFYKANLEVVNQPNHPVLFSIYKCILSPFVQTLENSLVESLEFYGISNDRLLSQRVMEVNYLSLITGKEINQSLEERITLLKTALMLYKEKNFEMYLVEVLATFTHDELDACFEVINKENKDEIKKLLLQLREKIITHADMMPECLPDLAYTAIGMHFKLKPYIKTKNIQKDIQKSKGVYFFHSHANLASYQTLISWMPMLKATGVNRFYVELPKELTDTAVTSEAELEKIFDRMEKLTIETSKKLIEKMDENEKEKIDQHLLEHEQSLEQAVVPFYFKLWLKLLRTAVKNGIQIYLIDSRKFDSTLDESFSKESHNQIRLAINQKESEPNDGKFIALFGVAHASVAASVPGSNEYYPTYFFLPAYLMNKHKDCEEIMLNDDSSYHKNDVFTYFSLEFLRSQVLAVIPQIGNILLLPCTSKEVSFYIRQENIVKEIKELGKDQTSDDNNNNNNNTTLVTMVPGRRNF